MNACIVSCLANVDLSKSVQSMKEKLAAEREPGPRSSHHKHPRLFELAILLEQAFNLFFHFRVKSCGEIARQRICLLSN
jgi:hypothetical protein